MSGRNYNDNKPSQVDAEKDKIVKDKFIPNYQIRTADIGYVPQYIIDDLKKTQYQKGRKAR